MSRIIAGCVVAFCLISASSSFAQIIYEGVQYQYSSGGSLYYYGGDNPRIHAAANHLSGETSYGRSNGYAFHSGNIDTHREVVNEPTRIFTDMMPFENGRFYGYTVDDAKNAANARAATYFRKADALRTARPMADGTWVVPVQADASGRGTIEIKPGKPMSPPVVTPVVGPTPILIIPKRLLEKPLWPKDSITADAR